MVADVVVGVPKLVKSITVSVGVPVVVVVGLPALVWAITVPATSVLSTVDSVVGVPKLVLSIVSVGVPYCVCVGEP